MSKDKPSHVDLLPDVIFDPSTKKNYLKGQFLGKGGFAKCYELIDSKTKYKCAGKIVSKTLLTKPREKEKMFQEISIHKSLSHKHIVGFERFFEDKQNVYILLELCNRRSLMELHKRRKIVTEPEARYFTYHVTLACDYLHDRRIIHRDLKLGNLLLNDNMEVKIGDFGLATEINFEGERKKTLCGTPNYMAPEVLNKKGHSYEVDSWSLGCILYTLLLGAPPFETRTLHDTYDRIKKNIYHIPLGRMSLSAKNLIEQLLQPEPSFRPSMKKVLKDDFITKGFLPHGLPTSCLSTAPRFDQSIIEESQIPLLALNGGLEKESEMIMKMDTEIENKDGSADGLLNDLLKLLNSVTSSKVLEKALCDNDDAEDPAATPIFWISKWVDYSDKYGLGYQLCDNSYGVLFNDATRMILASNGDNVQYIERSGTEHFYQWKSLPSFLEKKVILINYFTSYMSRCLLKAGAKVAPREVDEMERLPYLRAWFRTRNAIIFHLSNGTVQANFFEDHIKVVLCPLMEAMTCITENGSARTFKLSLIEKYGCSKITASKIKYMVSMVEKLLTGVGRKDA